MSHKVMRDVMQVSKAPIFASHSSVASICNTTRNLPDDVLVAMKKVDGVAMINFWTSLISCSRTSTISQVLDHIMHVISVAGAEHVGFGGDFDGIPTHTTGLENVSKYPELIIGLLKRGINENDIAKIMGGNVIRVLRKTEEVARSMKDEIPDATVVYFNKTC